MIKLKLLTLSILLSGSVMAQEVVPVDSVHHADSPNSMAMEQWTPTREGECSQELHDSYFGIGYKGRKFPTWHPPVDPSGCFMGHEHGDDPSLSPIYDPAHPVLFGEVNEMAMEAGIGMIHRKEDHAGHKIIRAQVSYVTPGSIANGGGIVKTTCDVIAKFHQGTHSPDAFTNNLHEQLYMGRCDDGLEFDTALLSQIGAAGYLKQQCGTQPEIYVGPPTPLNSPTKATSVQRGGSMGHRFLPTLACVAVARPNMFEIWKTQNGLMGMNGRLVFGYANYWSVGNPFRFFDTVTAKMGYNFDVCWLSHPTLNQYLVISNPCLTVRKMNPPIDRFSTLSPFKGTQRGLRPDSLTLKNAAGVEEWYTDAYGLNPSLTPNEKSYIKQMVSVMTYTESQVNGGGDSVSRDFNAPGIHGPN